MNESREIAKGTIEAKGTLGTRNFGNYWFYGNYRNYGKGKLFKKTREITIGIIGAIGTLGTVGIIGTIGVWKMGNSCIITLNTLWLQWFYYSKYFKTLIGWWNNH